MAVAKLDENSRPTLTALSNANDGTIVQLWADPVTHRLLVDAASATSLTIGVTTISSGTTSRILYDNAGILGEYTITGTGTVVAMATSPSFTTPSLGVATATSINGNIFTTGSSTYTGTAGQTYTFPTTTSTLLATNGAGTSLTGIPYTLTGTANQVVLSAGTGNITFSLPQDIATSSNPQFATIELGAASDTTLARVSAGVMSVEGVRVITSAGTTSGTILKNNGTTFVASTETYATPGSSGNVMTSDGTNWTSAGAAVPSTSNTRASYDLTTASGTQTVAHGLGRTPKFVSVSAVYASTAVISHSWGSYNGTSNSSCSDCMTFTAGALSTSANTFDNANAIVMYQTTNGATGQTGVITVDATNITITWTKSGSPTGTATFNYQVF